MNGVHDMGGVHGLGPVEHEQNEPLFHHRWEARALAITLAVGGWRKWNIDHSRHAREKIPGAEYLRMGYYEKWITALIEQMVEVGLVTREEVERGQPAAGTVKATPPLTMEKVARVLAAGGPANRDLDAPPRFAVGQTVRTRNLHPTGHTRLPRYARDKQGVVNIHHGSHVFPDTNAHFQGENPQHLYSVRFSARELWGEQAAPRDTVCLDLWESYLEPI